MHWTVTNRCVHSLDARSGKRINQRPEHFVGRLGDIHAQLHLELALGHIDHVAGHVRLLATVHRTQAIDLNFGRLAGDRTLDRVVGDLAGGLIDAVLPCLNSAQTGIERGIS